MSEIELFLRNVVVLFAVAFAVRLVVDWAGQLSYTGLLVAVGLGISITDVPLGIRLSSDVILVGFVPAIVFDGALGISIRDMTEDIVPILLLTVVGLPIAIGLLAAVGTLGWGFPPLIAVLFATIVLPTDPAAVLSVFEEQDVATDLSVMVEGESLLNDGVAIAIFSTVLTTHQASATPQQAFAQLTTPSGLATVGITVLVVGGGGVLFGLLVGTIGHAVERRLTDRSGVVLLTVIVAYGGFLVAEELLGVSGVLAVVGAGLVMVPHESSRGGIDAQETFVEYSWEFTAFLASTLLYLLIGSQVEPSQFLRYWHLVVGAAVLVVAVRGLTVYPLVAVSNRVSSSPVTRSWQHLMVWGGFHTVVPVALALSLPPAFPYRDEIQATVFGVAIFGTVIQGLLMPAVIRTIGVGSE
ncbi:cation:proton antiporter [Halorientalis brevis]|uniref:Cation:proton antiporter n=1 Tax=Halorientalis brevis TaxID=1126241 RepID=A0ABD6CFZ0_9EURY|nr:cation:proton antiporter [Halorientalis brevis]